MTQIERITHMEELLDTVGAAVRQLSDALEAFSGVQKEVKELSTYYGSEAWQEDYNADCDGLLPPDLKRGVLSEDGAYEVLSRRDELVIELLEVAAAALRAE